MPKGKKNAQEMPKKTKFKGKKNKFKAKKKKKNSPLLAVPTFYNYKMLPFLKFNTSKLNSSAFTLPLFFGSVLGK